MIFDPKTNALYADDGELLKYVHCPLALRIRELERLVGHSPDRFCNHCSRTIRNADDMTDADMRQAVRQEGEELCVFATPEARHIVVLQPQAIGYVNSNTEGRPLIRTARTLEAMIDGFRSGLRPLVKQAGPTSKIGPKLKIWQRRHTGELWVTGDYRSDYPGSQEEGDAGACWDLVADWFQYRPDWPFPYAAYLVPRGIALGAKVYLEDLIEDVPVEVWNQGDSQRLLSANATWVGDEFELEWTEPPCSMVG